MQEQYWSDDYRFYSLDTFPEFCTLVICCWPGLFARMAQQWPRPTGIQDEGKGSDRQAPNGEESTQPEAERATEMQEIERAQSQDSPEDVEAQR